TRVSSARRSSSSPYRGSSGSYVVVIVPPSPFRRRPPRRCEVRDAETVRSGNSSGGDALQALGEATGVRLLGACERLEPLRDLVEAFVARGLREARVHLGVLVGLALDGGLEVVLGGADLHVGDGVADLGEEVEVTERVTRLALCDRAEQRRHVGVALDVRLLGEVQVPPVRLALAGERFLQVLVGLRTLELRHRFPFGGAGQWNGSRRTCPGTRPRSW